MTDVVVMKVCAKCKISKPKNHENFRYEGWEDADKKIRFYQSRCKPCMRLKYIELNEGRVLKKRGRKKLTPEQKEKSLEKSKMKKRISQRKDYKENKKIYAENRKKKIYDALSPEDKKIHDELTAQGKKKIFIGLYKQKIERDKQLKINKQLEKERKKEERMAKRLEKQKIKRYVTKDEKIEVLQNKIKELESKINVNGEKSETTET